MISVSIKVLGLTPENRNRLEREVSFEKSSVTISDVLKEVQNDIESLEDVIDIEQGEIDYEITVLKNGNPISDLKEELEDTDKIVVLAPMPGG